MTANQEPNCQPDSRRRNLWNALADHWFGELHEDEVVGLPARWLIASVGSMSFFGAVQLLESREALSPVAVLENALQFALIATFSILLGFLLAWKRKRTGPVRLYVSGIVLPYFLFLAARITAFF